jgi:hypothetical protein
MANALADLSRPAPPVSLRAEVIGSSGVSLVTQPGSDPRITGVQIVRYAVGSKAPAAVCEAPKGNCIDHPAGHRRYTYAAVSKDAWGESLPVRSQPVAVPDSAPLLRVLGPRRVRKGVRYVYRVVVRDRDRDVVTLRWWLDGALERGRSASRTFRFAHAGSFRIEVRASDGHGRASRATSNIVVR